MAAIPAMFGAFIRYAFIVLALTPSGFAETFAFTTLAGAYNAGEQLRDGIERDARFNASSMAIDAAGNLYLAEPDNYTIRKVSPTGVVTTLAGTAGSRAIQDGPVASARFFAPSQIAVSPGGDLYVFDRFTLRKISLDGVVTTLAGSSGEQGEDDGTGPAARFGHALGLAVDRNGNIFVGAPYAGTIRKVTPAGVVTTLPQPRMDTVVPLFDRFRPTGLAIDRLNNLYVADEAGGTLRKITPVGEVSILAGAMHRGDTIDGDGANAGFHYPRGAAADAAGNIFVTEGYHSVIRRASSTGEVVTIAGQVSQIGTIDGLGGNARFMTPGSVAVDAAGSLYILDGATAIRKGTRVDAAEPPILQNPSTWNERDFRYVGARSTVTFSGKARGTAPLVYQWIRDGLPLPGATGSSLTLVSAAPADQGIYAVVISNAAGTVTSRPISLRVYTPTLAGFTSRRSVPGGNFLWGITSGGGQIVVVGTRGTILTSSDGRTWTAQASGTNEWLLGVAYGNGRYVAVGDHGVILVSSDGMRWTRARSVGTSERLNNVTFGAGVFVAVGERGTAVRSSDAQTWTAQSTGVTTWLRGLVYVPEYPRDPNLIWWGWDGTGCFYASGEAGVMLYSFDGALWHRDTAEFSGKDIEALAAGPIGIGQDGVTISHDATMVASKVPVRRADGSLTVWIGVTRRWYSSQMGIAARFRGLARGADALFATGENGIIAASWAPSGPWSIIPTGTTANLVNGVFHGNTMYVVGENETILQSQAFYRSRLINISTRGIVGDGGAVMISGFVVSGSAPKRVLLRAAGPALASLGVSGTLATPKLTLFDAHKEIASNAGWSRSRDAAAIATAAAESGAFPFVNGSDDSALLITLEPGAYTAHVASENGAGGIALVEAYDAESAASEGSRAINVSTCGFVGTGAAQLIAGFVIDGAASRRVLIRAVGPSLGQFGLGALLADPQLVLFEGPGYRRQTATAWSAQSNADEISAAALMVGAFPLQNGSRDAAIVASLFPGSYTVQVSGLNNTSGIAMVEVYDLP